jgi:hypothetical protein
MDDGRRFLLGAFFIELDTTIYGASQSKKNFLYILLHVDEVGKAK